MITPWPHLLAKVAGIVGSYHRVERTIIFCNLKESETIKLLHNHDHHSCLSSVPKNINLIQPYLPDISRLQNIISGQVEK